MVFALEGDSTINIGFVLIQFLNQFIGRNLISPRAYNNVKEKFKKAKNSYGLSIDLMVPYSDLL